METCSECGVELVGLEHGLCSLCISSLEHSSDIGWGEQGIKIREEDDVCLESIVHIVHVQCEFCGDVYTSEKALEHWELTGHNSWTLLW